MNTRKKRAVGAVSAVAALAMIGGVAAQFTTSATSESQSINTGTLAISLDNVSDTVWTDPIENLAAGDSIQRFVDVRNSGSLKFSGLSINQTNTLGDLLTAPSDITIKLESCSVVWDYATGTCSGKITPTLDASSVRQWSGFRQMAGFDSFDAGAISHLKLTTSVASSATNAIQGKKGTITYTVTGTQRAATNFGVRPDGSYGELAAAAAAEAPLNGLDVSAGSWSRTADLSTARHAASSAADAAGNIYTFAGSGGPSTSYELLASGEKYNSATNTWTPTASMNTPRRDPATATGADGNIYVMGGGTMAGLTDSVERYDPRTDSWSSAASMPTARTRGAAVAGPDGFIYLVSGSNNYAAGSSMDRYDPATDSWTSMAPAPTARIAGSAVVINGNIYVMGGAGRDSTDVLAVDKYNIATKTWSSAPALPFGAQYGAASTDGAGNIYFSGGQSAQASKMVQRYNVFTKTWTRAADLPVAAPYVTGVSDAAGHPYVIGGYVNGDVTSAVTRLG